MEEEQIIESEATEQLDNEAVEQPTVEETTETEDVQTTDESSESEQESENPARKKGVEKRFGELTRKRYEAEREARYWREQAESKDQPVAQESAKPKLDDYEDHESYYEDLAAYKANEIIARDHAATQERAEADKAKARQTSFSDKLDAKEDKPDDFYDVVYSNIPINDGMAEFITDSELGPDIAYYLGSNPHEAERIASLSPVMAGRELTRIEADLVSPENTPTATPAPIKPSGNKAQVTKDPSQMTDNEFGEWRRKKIKNRSNYG